MSRPAPKFVSRRRVAGPKEGRNNPRFHHSGGHDRLTITNKHEFPDIHFHWVSLQSPTHGVEYWKSLGHEICVKGPDGPRCAVGATVMDGEEISNTGLVLMCCHINQKQEQDAIGVDGDGGQELADYIDAQSIVKHKGRSVFRGAVRNSMFQPE